MELPEFPADFASPHGLCSLFLTQTLQDAVPLAASRSSEKHGAVSPRNLSVDQRDIIAAELRVHRNQPQIFTTRLRDQQAVEWV